MPPVSVSVAPERVTEPDRVPESVAPLMVGDVRVFVVRVSAPSRVARVPVAGNVTELPSASAARVIAATVVVKPAASVRLPVRSMVRAASLTVIVSVRSALRFSLTAMSSSWPPNPD